MGGRYGEYYLSFDFGRISPVSEQAETIIYCVFSNIFLVVLHL